MLSILRPFTCLALALLLASCNQKKPLSSAAQDHLEKSSFEQLFDCIDTLLFSPSAVVGEVSRMVAMHTGRKVVGDNTARKFYFFSADGKADWQFGRYGKGEGEFEDISDFSFSRDGYLFILDAALKRITVLKDTSVVKTFTFTLGTSLWAEDTSQVYVYDASIVNAMENVFRYDWNGNLISKCGRPSEATLAAKVPVSKGSIVLAENSLYTLSAIDYEIKLYKRTGEYVKSFAHLPEFYLSISEIFKGGPSREKLKNLTTCYPMFLTGALDKKMLVVQISHLKERYLHLYDLDGRFIKEVKIPTSTYLIGADDNFLYFLKEAQIERESPKILVYAPSQKRRL